MSSNIEVERVCELCNKRFIARKTTTLYCSHKCSSTAYKAKKRAEKVATASIQATSKPIEAISQKAMLSVTDAARLLGVTRPTLYRWMEVGKLEKTVKLTTEKRFKLTP